MPLDDGAADVVRFECASCGKEHSRLQMKKLAAICSKCQSNTWTLVTEFYEGQVARGPMPTLIHLAFGVRVMKNQYETIRIVTSQVLAADILKIADAAWRDYRRVAFRYMEYRRALDAERDRQAMRERGGKNCTICGTFFMPSLDKPWTQVDCCSKACLARTDFVPTLVMPDGPENTVPSMGQPCAVVQCRCGHQFDVSMMYVGTRRACPKCGEKTLVSPANR